MNTESARTLEELDGEHWEEPDDRATGLIRNAHRLRTVPIGSLSVDDLRLLLGQQIGVQWLVPVALEHLREDRFAGGLYQGDLLNAVLRAGSKYWDEHPAETMSLWLVREALEGVRDEAETLLTRDDWPAFG
ncbi:MAG TPA: contact-dependent growth inhibition system immunity protein [Candidatus Limnocylindrales bacterium]|nr:contact-dependent growth inhibition system immunity protein [Candidatus Limnocylindrales bacterium]